MIETTTLQILFLIACLIVIIILDTYKMNVIAINRDKKLLELTIESFRTEKEHSEEIYKERYNRIRDYLMEHKCLTLNEFLKWGYDNDR